MRWPGTGASTSSQSSPTNVTSRQAADLVQQSVLLGIIQYQAMIMPESTKVKQREVWRWLKSLGIPRTTLDKWVESGIVHRHKDLTKGENSAVWYHRIEIQQAIVSHHLTTIP